MAAINRAMSPNSKRSMWELFSKTVLLRRLPHATSNNLTSQRFWDHMDRIDGNKPLHIWKTILKGVVKREEIDLSCVSYDGTNFYTFIDTFNTLCQIAKRGKNKQGRNNLRQINYALFCCAVGHLPLYYNIYQGNRNDAKQFPLMLKKFHNLLADIAKQTATTTATATAYELPLVTLVFDKGNNSADNFALLDYQTLSYVGSVKLEEHKELVAISNHNNRFSPCNESELEGSKAFRVKKTVYGKKKVLVVTYFKTSLIPSTSQYKTTSLKQWRSYL